MISAGVLLAFAIYHCIFQRHLSYNCFIMYSIQQ